MKKIFNLKKIAFFSIYTMVFLLSCTKKDEPTPAPIVIKPQLVTVADYQDNTSQNSFIYPWQPDKVYTAMGAFFSEGRYFAFEAGDTLLISYTTQNADRLEINGFEVANLSREITLRSYTTSQTDKIIIPQRMVISLLTYGRIRNSMPRIKLQRMPKSVATQNFDTTITFQESRRAVAANTAGAIRVGEWQAVKTGTLVSLSPQVSFNSSRAAISVTTPELPPNTLYWIYRFVCNNKNSVQNFERNNALLSEIKNLKIDPRVTLGAAVIQLLMPIPGTAKCDVDLVQGNINRDKFLRNEVYNRYPSFSTSNVAQFTQAVNINLPPMFLCFVNNRTNLLDPLFGADVDINLNIVAAVENWYLIIRTPIIGG